MKDKDLARFREILGSNRRQRSANSPVEKSITYNFESAAEAKAAMDGELPAYLRVRKKGSSPNATVALLEHKLALWEQGEYALAVASGMAAVSLATETAMENGRNAEAVLFVPAYGGTWNFFQKGLTRVHFVHANSAYPVQELNAVLNRKTRLVFLEPLTNPSLDVLDVAAIARTVHTCAPKALVVVDNTFPSSYNLQPLELGADIVVISLTKYHNGFSDTMAGAIIAGPRCTIHFSGFWEHLCENYKFQGPVLGIDAAGGLLTSLETYAVRMDRHNRNAMRLAQWLQQQPLVYCVRYPGLINDYGHRIASTYMHTPEGHQGFSGMLSFRIKGGIPARDAFLDSFPFSGNNLVRHAPSLGSIKTLVETAAIVSHGSIDPVLRQAARIDDCDLRVSVGIEEPFELVIEDFKAGLENAGKVITK